MTEPADSDICILCDRPILPGEPFEESIWQEMESDEQAPVRAHKYCIWGVIRTHLYNLRPTDRMPWRSVRQNPLEGWEPTPFTPPWEGKHETSNQDQI